MAMPSPYGCLSLRTPLDVILLYLSLISRIELLKINECLLLLLLLLLKDETPNFYLCKCEVKLTNALLIINITINIQIIT